MSELVAIKIFWFVAGFVAGAWFILAISRMRDDELK